MAEGKSDWQPTASRKNLQQRAQLLAALRQFFADRNVLEVETPVLSHHTVTDVHLKSFAISPSGSPNQTMFLQTSPEYAMKRLLANGSGSIYQICKAFRQEEQTKQHNPEFTLLEWYRVGFNLDQLMDEVAEMICNLLDCDAIPRISYQQLFEDHLDFDPHRITSTQLQLIAAEQLDVSGDQLTDTDYLQLLMHHRIEPQLPAQCFVYDYPTEQAALSRIEKNEAGALVGRRFELYCQGMEIANGYSELTDPIEQRARFEKDNAARTRLGLDPVLHDERLLSAMEYGLPECAGVALGVDRLAMVIANSSDITDVVSIPFDRA